VSCNSDGAGGHVLVVSREQPDEIARLYEAHAGAIHAYALRRSDREVADEVTARVFLVAARRRASIPAEALPWLYGVARKVLSEERRGAARRVALRERLAGAAAEHTIAGEPHAADLDLAEALRSLSELDREALLLRYWEELSPEQLAVALGCSKTAAAVRLHRARARLRRKLARSLRGGAEACSAGVES
jgi:RNA polymerase sigma-70 factor, ECF subfamily